MAHHLQFLPQFAQEFHGLKETINLGAQCHAEVEVKDVVETIGRIPYHSTGVRVPLLTYLAGVHAVVHRQRRCDVEVLEHVEGGLHRYGMAHAVEPL